METVLDYLSDYGEITTKELQNLLEVKRTLAYVITKQMIDAGLIKAIGRGENKKYIAVKKHFTKFIRRGNRQNPRGTQVPGILPTIMKFLYCNNSQ